MSSRVSDAVRAAADDLFARRIEPARAFAADAERVARACYNMAQRFHRGGKLLVFGMGAPSTDAQHVSVEFVHPVIVGKRAFQAMSLAGDVATVTGLAESSGLSEVFAHQIRHLGAPQDVAIGISASGPSEAVTQGLLAARNLGMLTVELAADGGGVRNHGVDHAFVVVSDDPLVVKEVQVTAYHVLWELVHVFFEQPGVLGPEMVG